MYNVETFRRLAELGENLAANIDPSHFFWMQMDALAVMSELSDRVGHVHAKDVWFNERVLATAGLLDHRWPGPTAEVPWKFATVGRGHDAQWWSAFMALVEGTAATAVAIEHEDPDVPPVQGVAEAAQILAGALEPGGMNGFSGGVRFEEVWKLFGEDNAAVANLNLHIHEGEFLVLVGPSGCGKTTSLRMLAGLERPTFGRIWFGDRDVTTLSPGERDVAMVFQSYALYPNMTVYRNLAFGPTVRGESKKDLRKRVDEVAEVLGIGALLSRRPNELSGGQRQRVALGRALLRDSQLFLLDEPLSNLDAALRVQMRAELIRLHKRLTMTTSVYVTHDQIEALTMGDRVAVLKDGDVMQCATPSGLYENPANSFVAGVHRLAEDEPAARGVPGRRSAADPQAAGRGGGASSAPGQGAARERWRADSAGGDPSRGSAPARRCRRHEPQRPGSRAPSTSSSTPAARSSSRSGCRTSSCWRGFLARSSR